MTALPTSWKAAAVALDADLNGVVDGPDSDSDGIMDSVDGDTDQPWRRQ